MEKILLIVVFVTFTLNCFSQDYLVLRDGTEKAVVIQQVTSDVIKYKYFGSRTSTIYTIYKSEVKSIIYEDGEEEVFTIKERLSSKENSTSMKRPVSREGNTSNRNYSYYDENYFNRDYGQLEMVGNKVYMDGRKISRKELNYLFQGTNALPLYKSSRKQKTGGFIFSILGAVPLGLGIGILSSSSDSNSSVSENRSTSIGCIIAGASFVTVGFILTHQVNKNMKRAVDIYNRPRSYHDYSLNYGFVGNGIGVQLTF